MLCQFKAYINQITDLFYEIGNEEIYGMKLAIADNITSPNKIPVNRKFMKLFDYSSESWEETKNQELIDLTTDITTEQYDQIRYEEKQRDLNRRILATIASRRIDYARRNEFVQEEDSKEDIIPEEESRKRKKDDKILDSVEAKREKYKQRKVKILADKRKAEEAGLAERVNSTIPTISNQQFPAPVPAIIRPTAAQLKERKLRERIERLKRELGTDMIEGIDIDQIVDQTIEQVKAEQEQREQENQQASVAELEIVAAPVVEAPAIIVQDLIQVEQIENEIRGEEPEFTRERPRRSNRNREEREEFAPPDEEEDVSLPPRIRNVKKKKVKYTRPEEVEEIAPRRSTRERRQTEFFIDEEF
jgi:hypothetical protein